MANSQPWHIPGRWHAVPAFWEPQMQAQLPNKPAKVRLVDCTLHEGPDAVGCHLGWKWRVELGIRLDEAGVGAITAPGGCSYKESTDWVRAMKKHGVRALIVNKMALIGYPLPPRWKESLDRQFDIGGDVYILFSNQRWSDMVSGFTKKVTKAQVIDAIQEGVHYAKNKGIHVNYCCSDTMRQRLSALLAFYKAAVEAGADSIYMMDSRGNTNPLVAYYMVKKFKELVGNRPIYIQFHNDLGMATGNSFAAAMAGATMLDCSVLGIGDRGGCVPLEEIACALEMYGVRTGIKLEKLYELAKSTEKAFSVETQLWKPIVGRGAFMENGWGHRSASDPEETSAGLAPQVVGRGSFQSMLGGRVFSDRDTHFWTDMLDLWGYIYTDADLAEVKERTMHAIISQRGAIDTEEFRTICEGVLGGDRASKKEAKKK